MQSVSPSLTLRHLDLARLQPQSRRSRIQLSVKLFPGKQLHLCSVSTLTVRINQTHKEVLIAKCLRC